MPKSSKPGLKQHACVQKRVESNQKKKLQDFLAPCFEAGRYNMGGASEFSQIFTKSGFQRATRALAIGQGPLGRGQELISGTRGITQRLG
jgi:hypothetical protein